MDSSASTINADRGGCKSRWNSIYRNAGIVSSYSEPLLATRAGTGIKTRHPPTFLFDREAWRGTARHATSVAAQPATRVRSS